ncbi:hypothetical protein PCL_11458 [Purpureocillium lilacinum]|uniref:Uncharacterized protein n=1 Tax=Purpureocillium lilacinum TaxID=33203 RepID=A0A2U3EA42_PURLI|nr:hypothetical protein PCL_11458 [Purpureocillium lilacinum]
MRPGTAPRSVRATPKNWGSRDADASAGTASLAALARYVPLDPQSRVSHEAGRRHSQKTQEAEFGSHLWSTSDLAGGPSQVVPFTTPSSELILTGILPATHGQANRDRQPISATPSTPATPLVVSRRPASTPPIRGNNKPRRCYACQATPENPARHTCMIHLSLQCAPENSEGIPPSSQRLRYFLPTFDRESTSIYRTPAVSLRFDVKGGAHACYAGA